MAKIKHPVAADMREKLNILFSSTNPFNHVWTIIKTLSATTNGLTVAGISTRVASIAQRHPTPIASKQARLAYK
ncbi:hypothetical protein AA700_0967 [Acidiphilium acidophilum DSM 700]|nr:hypothetical protein AA700_0967 [Acidiphilium acidophilum DSM 700]